MQSAAPVGGGAVSHQQPATNGNTLIGMDLPARPQAELWRYEPTPDSRPWVNFMANSFAGDFIRVLSITQAVRGNEGTKCLPPPTESDYTPMPDDFVPPLGKCKKSASDPRPIEDRLGHMNALDKRTDKTSPLQLSYQDMELSIKSLRDGAVAWCTNKIENFAISALDERYPGKIMINGRAVACLGNFFKLDSADSNDQFYARGHILHAG